VYDLINMQIADAASATSKPVFEVAEMTDAHLLLIDLRLPRHVSIFQYPAHVVSLLSCLGILGSRQVFFNGVQDKPYELLHNDGQFNRISQRSENKVIAKLISDKLREYPDLKSYKESSNGREFVKFRPVNGTLVEIFASAERFAPESITAGRN
jgi:hypothetical protein